MPYKVKIPAAIYTDSLDKLGTSVMNLSKWCEDEFNEIASNLQGTEADFIWYRVPPKPQRGTYAYADGINWNPGFGEGPYAYNGSVWSPLINSAVGQVPGIGTNTPASAGKVGEVIATSGTTGSLTTGTATTIATLNLTAGDWDVSAAVQFNTAGATSVTDWYCSLSTTLNSIGAPYAGSVVGHVRVPATLDYSHPLFVHPVQALINATTSFYLNVRADFTSTAPTATYAFRARRMR